MSYGRGDRAEFGAPAMRRAFLANVRFDADPAAEVAEGLSLASLELSAFDRLALRGMTRDPGLDAAARRGPIGIFAAKARQLVQERLGASAWSRRPKVTRRPTWPSAGPCSAPGSPWPVRDGGAADDVASRAGERAGPCDAALLEALRRDRVAALRDAFRVLVPELDGGRPSWLKRFGFAPPPSGRTGGCHWKPVITHTGPIREGVL
jgi:hypothetical protein